MFYYYFSYFKYGYATRINYFSSPAVAFQETIPTGDELNDNAAQIRRTRFILAESGTEDLTCDWKSF